MELSCLTLDNKSKTMKRFKLKNNLTLLALVFFVVFPFQNAAASPDDGNEGEAGEEIVVNPEIIHDQGGHGRDLITVPIEAFLLRDLSVVHVSQNSSIEIFVIRLTHLPTNSVILIDMGTTIDCYVPVLFGQGSYHLEFLSEFGTNFNGYFYM